MVLCMADKQVVRAEFKIMKAQVLGLELQVVVEYFLDSQVMTKLLVDHRHQTAMAEAVDKLVVMAAARETVSGAAEAAAGELPVVTTLA